MLHTTPSYVNTPLVAVADTGERQSVVRYNPLVRKEAVSMAHTSFADLLDAAAEHAPSLRETAIGGLAATPTARNLMLED